MYIYFRLSSFGKSLFDKPDNVKLVLANFIHFTKRDLLKIMANAFYFTEKAHFVLKIFKFLFFHLFLFFPLLAIV